VNLLDVPGCLDCKRLSFSSYSSYPHLFLHFMQFLFQSGDFIVGSSRRPSQLIWSSGRSDRSSGPMSARMSGASRAFLPVSARGKGFLCFLTFSIPVDRPMTISFLIFPSTFFLRRRLIVIEGLWRSWWLLSECLP
jgi:hypothetical protein